MSECWHYIRFGTISDGTISGMHCITYLLWCQKLQTRVEVEKVKTFPSFIPLQSTLIHWVTCRHSERGSIADSTSPTYYHCTETATHSLRQWLDWRRQWQLGPARFSNICESWIHGSPENRDFKSVLDSGIDSFNDKIHSFWWIVDSLFTWKSGFWINSRFINRFF